MRLRLRVAPFGAFNVCSVVPILDFFLPSNGQRFNGRPLASLACRRPLAGDLEPSRGSRLVATFYGDEVRDGADHTPHGDVVRQDAARAHLGEPQTPGGRLCPLGAGEAASD